MPYTLSHAFCFVLYTLILFYARCVIRVWCTTLCYTLFYTPCFIHLFYAPCYTHTFLMLYMPYYTPYVDHLCYTHYILFTLCYTHVIVLHHLCYTLCISPPILCTMCFVHPVLHHLLFTLCYTTCVIHLVLHHPCFAPCVLHHVMTSVSADVFMSPTAAGVSELTLWSINARLIGRVFCHSRMMCVAFSNAPEGISVNAVAAGCQDGIIRWVEKASWEWSSCLMCAILCPQLVQIPIAISYYICLVQFDLSCQNSYRSC